MKFSNKKKYVQGVHGHVGLSVALKLHTIKAKKSLIQNIKKMLNFDGFSVWKRELTKIKCFWAAHKNSTVSGMDSQYRFSSTFENH